MCISEQKAENRTSKRGLFAAAIIMMVLIFAAMPVKTFAATEQERYEAEVKKILSGMNKNWKKVEKLFYIHDYIVTHTEYGGGHFAYDAILRHKAVCSGYAAAFKDLSNRAGIPAVIVGSDTMSHAWNAVKLNGKWYYIDCTFDDPIGPTNPQFCKHENFLRSEAGMRKTNHHGKFDSIGPNGERIKCTDTTYEKMGWVSALNIPVTLLSDGIAYYDTDSCNLYTYDCRSKKSRKVKNLEKESGRKESGNVYYGDKITLTGAGKNVFVGTGDAIYYHKYGTSVFRRIYVLSEQERKLGVISHLKMVGNSLRYNLGDEQSSTDKYFDKSKVHAADYISVKKAVKMTAPKLEIKGSDSKTLMVGESIELETDTIDINNPVWKSDNPSVATVNNGKVTAKNPGACLITVSEGKICDSCVIIVKSTEQDVYQEPVDPIDAAGESDSEWLNDYDFYIRQYYREDLLYLDRYHGDASSLTVPSTAIYQEKKYRVVVTSGFIGADTKVQKLSFTKGVIIETQWNAFLASGSQTLRSIDLRGCVMDRSETLFIARNCPKLQSINMKGMDMSRLRVFVSEGCGAIDTIVMPKYAYIFYFENGTSLRIYDNGEYGSTPYGYLIHSYPVNKTLKKLPKVAKKGKQFSISGITYKVTNTSMPSVAVVKIKGSRADIPAMVTYKGIKYWVRSIGAGAASGNTSLKQVTIGSAVTGIGSKAFYKCKNLTTIKVKSGVITKISAKALSGTYKKASVDVPDDCTSNYKKMLKKAGLSTKAKVK